MQKSFVPVFLACLMTMLGVACGDDDGPGGTAGVGGGTAAGTGGDAGTGGQVSAGTGGQTTAGTGGQTTAGTGGTDQTAGTGGEAGGDPVEAAACVQRAIDGDNYAGREACVDCGCDNCADELELCYNSGDAEKDALCIAVVECGQTAGCRGSACYCGDGVDTIACALGGPMGPCVNEIEAAAYAADELAPVLAVGAARDSNDPSIPLVRANRVGACTRGMPAVAGGLGVMAQPAVTGHCEQECM